MQMRLVYFWDDTNYHALKLKQISALKPRFLWLQFRCRKHKYILFIHRFVTCIENGLKPIKCEMCIWKTVYHFSINDHMTFNGCRWFYLFFIYVMPLIHNLCAISFPSIGFWVGSQKKKKLKKNEKYIFMCGIVIESAHK